MNSKAIPSHGLFVFSDVYYGFCVSQRSPRRPPSLTAPFCVSQTTSLVEESPGVAALIENRSPAVLFSPKHLLRRNLIFSAARMQKKKEKAKGRSHMGGAGELLAVTLSGQQMAGCRWAIGIPEALSWLTHT